MAKHSTGACPLFPGLPDDLGLLCLSKLPIDAVARCRSVSRSWASALLQHPPAASRLPQPLACFWTGRINLRRKNSMAWLFFSRSDLRCHVVPFFNMNPCTTGIRIYSSQMQVIPTGTSLLLVRSKLELGGDSTIQGNDGNQEPSTLQGFDLWQMKWCREACDGWRMPPMHVDRWGFATAHVGKHVYVAGRDGSTARSAERLNIKTGRWEVLPEMIKERSAQPVGFAMGGRFYVAGGEFEPTTSMAGLTQSGEFYDPEKRMWMLVPGMWPEEIWGYGGISNVVVVKDEAYTVRERSEVMRLRGNGGWEMAGQLPHVPKFESTDWWSFRLVSVGVDELWVVYVNKDEEFHWIIYACNPYLAMDGFYWERLPFTIPPSARFGCVTSVGIYV